MLTAYGQEKLSRRIHVSHNTGDKESVVKNYWHEALDCLDDMLNFVVAIRAITFYVDPATIFFYFMQKYIAC